MKVLLGFLTVLIPALVLFFKYILGDKRQIKKVNVKIDFWESVYEQALRKRDTVAMSVASRKLKRLRAQARSLKRK